MPRTLSLKPRYYRWHVDPGVDWTEANTTYSFLDWRLPMEQVAVLALDVWQMHYLTETRGRIQAITAGRTQPLLKVVRGAGLRLIHAPGPRVALEHPNWVRMIREDEVEWPVHDTWPPREFTGRIGEFAAYRHPVEPRQPELDVRLTQRCFHPLSEPTGDEPVVANGEELHRYCKAHGILFLLFYGFNTNYCMMLNDYGMIHMNNRGYATVLLRDCTTGMESFESGVRHGQTRMAIQHLEMSQRFSITSPELIAALRAGS